MTRFASIAIARDYRFVTRNRQGGSSINNPSQRTPSSYMRWVLDIVEVAIRGLSTWLNEGVDVLRAKSVTERLADAHPAWQIGGSCQSDRDRSGCVSIVELDARECQQRNVWIQACSGECARRISER